MPKVSVIIPVYNVEPYLRECLDSVVNQTLKDIEIICVNDGSTDGSLAILEEYAEKDKRIKVFSQKNKGQSAARNVGLEVADGEYIYFMDSDDLIELDCLELLYMTSNENDLDILYFDADVFFESKELEKRHGNYSCYYDRKHNYEKVYLGKKLFSEMLQHGDYKPSPCLQFLKNNFIKEKHIIFFEGIIHEDNLFTFQSIMLAERVSHIERKLFHRRVRQNSTMTKNETSRNVIGFFTCFVEMLKFCLRNDIKNDAVQRHITSIFRNTQNKYNNLSEMEREKIKWDKNTFEYFMFQYLIKNPAPQRVNLNESTECTLERYKALQSQLNAVYQSRSYKLGRALTYIPRKIRGGIRCYQEHGLRYTLNRIKQKIENKLSKTDTDKKSVQALKDRQELAISIIMPVYNVECYLKKCLDSLLEQTYKNFEVICVDDGSTDSSLDILHQYAAKDKRVRVITQQNQFAGVARNNGLKYAKGEYVLFLDSDDFFEKDILANVYTKAVEDKADICLFGARRYDHISQQFLDMPWVLRTQYFPKHIPFSAKDSKDYIFALSSPCPWSKLFRRKFIEENSLEFMPLKRTNDLFFVEAALSKAERITYCKGAYVNYRINTGTNLQANNQETMLDFYKALLQLKEYLIKSEIYDTFAISYKNLVLSTCIYNWESIKNEDKKAELAKILEDKIFKELDSDHLEETEILAYNKGNYKKYVKLNEPTNNIIIEVRR